MVVNICQPHSNGALDVINMGLCIFSGPKWEDDTLNDLNEVSIVLNACDMAKKYRDEAESQNILDEILIEVKRAEDLHTWPSDIIHQVAVIGEESGEALQASLNYLYHGESKDLIREEVIQCAATCIRYLKNNREGDL